MNRLTKSRSLNCYNLTNSNSSAAGELRTMKSTMKLSKCLKRIGATYVHKLIAFTLGLYNYTLRTLCMYSGLR